MAAGQVKEALRKNTRLDILPIANVDSTRLQT